MLTGDDRYPDEEALKAHQGTEHYKSAMAKAAEDQVMAKAPTIMKLRALDGGFDGR